MVAALSKYEPLWKYLENHGDRQIRLSFDEIKSILGFDINHSFLTYKKESVQFGYQVGKISLKKKHVDFSKLEQSGHLEIWSIYHAEK